MLLGIFLVWRPLLRDPKDDLVLEFAVAAGCKTIVTYKVGDLRGAEGVSMNQPCGTKPDHGGASQHVRAVGRFRWRVRINARRVA